MMKKRQKLMAPRHLRPKESEKRDAERKEKKDKQKEKPAVQPQRTYAVEPMQLSTKAAMSIDNKANRETAQVVFLGDSIIMGIPGHLYRGRCIQNFGKNGACAEDLQVLSRSAKFASECSQVMKVMVIGYGTNNLWKDPVDIVVNQIMEAIDVLTTNYQEIHIVVLGVLPRGDTGSISDIDSLNRKIATFNRQLRHKVRNVMAHMSERITLMDIGVKFSENGKIIPEMYVADGIHVSPAGYEVFMAEIDKELTKVCGPAPVDQPEEEPEKAEEATAVDGTTEVVDVPDTADVKPEEENVEVTGAEIEPK